MSQVTIKIIEDEAQCAKWGYSEPVVMIGSVTSCSVIPAYKLCMHSLKFAISDVKRIHEESE